MNIITFRMENRLHLLKIKKKRLFPTIFRITDKHLSKNPIWPYITFLLKIIWFWLLRSFFSFYQNLIFQLTQVCLLPQITILFDGRYLGTYPPPTWGLRKGRSKKEPSTVHLLWSGEVLPIFQHPPWAPHSPESLSFLSRPKVTSLF